MQAAPAFAQDPASATPDQDYILISDPGTEETALDDPVDITGIAQILIQTPGGGASTCTGTLINPRTILFAKHCVAGSAANSYGTEGGKKIGIGFEFNTRNNSPDAPNESAIWRNGDANGNGKHQTNVAQSFYTADWVAYTGETGGSTSNPDGGDDIAIAVLDTPAADVPTWALLFSQLPVPDAITAEGGTGYNVRVAGYGAKGTGTTGRTGTDGRRRAAENILGGLMDRKTFLGFVNGNNPNLPDHNVYVIDFDDPLRGMSGASPFDFLYDPARRNAAGEPTEGIASAGDSGSALILQGFAREVVLGTLTGGGPLGAGQAPGTYSTYDYFQPLYLWWDWITANNPYHYVSAKAGDGAWTDPKHWVTTLDPAYMILADGQLVNGIPTSPGEELDGNSGGFGKTCKTTGKNTSCLDIGTGSKTLNGVETGIDAAVAERAAAEPEASPLPEATLANGLPGASDFVPNNAGPVHAESIAPRYFDVTLTAKGLTTLSGADITIDRLTIGTAEAALRIDRGASLSSLMDINQFAGLVTVDGTLSSIGDYTLFGGGLMGTGRINAPYLTSMVGQIAPGTPTTIGTLTIGGNLVLSSGSNLLINIGPNGTSDILAIVAGGDSEGSADLGGSVAFAPVAGSQFAAGNRYTFLTATGGVTNAFNAPASFSAILKPKLIYGAKSVTLEIEAGLYRDVVAKTSPVQNGYAQLLDQSRGATALAAIYGPLDLQNAETIQATLESWAPRTETLRGALATVALDNMARFYRSRLQRLDEGDMGGTLSMIGRPVQIAALNMTALGANLSAVRSDSGGEAVRQGKLPEDTSAFIAGGYLDGDSAPMTTVPALAGRNNFDGFYLAGGIEKALGDRTVLGFAISYTDIDGTTPVTGQQASGKLYQGTLYGKTVFAGGLELSTQFSAGLFDSETVRTASLLTTSYQLTGKDSSLAVTGEVALARNFDLGAVRMGPRIGARASHIGFSRYKENGGALALAYDRSAYNSAQARAGLALSGKRGSRFQPNLSIDYVHEFMDTPAAFGANFVGGVGPNAIFALAGSDKDWFELGGGVTVSTANIDLSVGADTTIGRDDVSNQSYRGTITVHF